MEQLQVGRVKKENKSKILTLRLTETEVQELNRLREEMQFESVRDFFLFGMDVIKKLEEWHSKKYSFFIGIPGERKSYQEVLFELNPETSKS